MTICWFSVWMSYIVRLQTACAGTVPDDLSCSVLVRATRNVKWHIPTCNSIRLAPVLKCTTSRPRAPPFISA